MNTDKLLETLDFDKDNGLVPLDKGYSLPGFAGILRGARALLMRYLPASTVAIMSDDEVSGTLFECQHLIPVSPCCPDGVDDEIVFMVPEEILKRCRVLQR